MGIRHMQGTSAFIEYIGPKGNLKRHSCRGCLEYFDGICKIKKAPLDGYSDNNAKGCKHYKANKEIIEEYENNFSQNYKSNSCKKKNNKVKKTVEEEPYYYK